MIHRLRRYGGSDRFGDFPRSIHVPPAMFRYWVTNWVEFIEYVPVRKPSVEPRDVTRETIQHKPYSD